MTGNDDQRSCYKEAAGRLYFGLTTHVICLKPARPKETTMHTPIIAPLTNVCNVAISIILYPFFRQSK